MQLLREPLNGKFPKQFTVASFKEAVLWKDRQSY